jgi:hypothetical protein
MKKLTLALLLILTLPATGAALQTDELLSLVAMPLAVAAVAEITDIPTQDLISFVAALNEADVPPPQFIEVVRYVPVALVDETIRPEFLTFVTTESRQTNADAFVLAIANRLRIAGAQEINVTAPPRVVVVERNFVPTTVVTRVDEIKVKRHPHGGPPGQLKKVIGVQTGAEVVHGSRVQQRPVAAVRIDDGDNDRGRGKGQAKQSKNKGNSGKGKGKGKG